MKKGGAVCAALVGCGLGVVSVKAGPEDRRLDPGEFRTGLKQRGLTELLELYLHEMPPDDPVDALLLERDVLLARYADPALPAARRRDALVEANRVLEQLIESHPEDLRAFEWQLELGRSLLYKEAEPFYGSILYRGGTAEDRRRLGEVMDRTRTRLGRLRVDLARELDRLERVPARDYERLEQSGHVERVETLGPQVEYMEHWVGFYRALARELDDPARGPELDAVLDGLKNRSGLLDTPHGVSHVQAQALLLAGMVSRQLRDFVTAARYLDAALATFGRIDREEEREDLKWVAHLGLLETVRVHRDSQRFEHAHRALQGFREYLESTEPDNFGLRLVHALAESSVRAAQAERARAIGNLPSAAAFENMRFERLIKLARQGSAYRDEIYACLYDLMDPQVRLEELHPFQACARIAGLLSEAATLGEAIEQARGEGESAVSATVEELEARRSAALDGAIELAERLLGFAEAGGRVEDAGPRKAGLAQSTEGVPAELLPEIHYNLGVAYLQRGRRLDAVRRFLAVARGFSQFRQAPSAAAAAVQVASELATEPSLREREDVQALYLQSLTTLVEGFPHTDAARYWTFFLAQRLHELGRYDEAAETFSRVDADHEYHAHARFLRVRAMAAALRDYTADSQAAPAEIGRRIAEVLGAVDAATQAAQSSPAEPAGDPRLRTFLAEAELLAAESLLNLGPSRAATALDRVEGFESRYPDQPELVGRVLRIRLMAYEQLGRLADAERAVPEYIHSDPDNAGATLQALFDSIRQDVERLRAGGQDQEARTKAESALVLARQIQRWSADDSMPVSADQRYAIELQLGQALLQAEHYDEAERAFAGCLAADPGADAAGAGGDARAIYGHAESLYQLNQFERALPLFHRACERLSPPDIRWYQALLRDLQCRTRLNHPPDGIIKAIRQQKFLHGDMGGRELRREFDELLRANERRLGTGSA